MVGSTSITRHLQLLLDELDADDFFFTLLLRTEPLDALRADGVFLEAHRLVDHGVEATAGGTRSLGVIVPLPTQADEIERDPRPGQHVMAAHASQYMPGGQIAEAGSALRGVDLIVMHCMGYTEAMREAAAKASSWLVLLARRLVAAEVRQFL